ncbi:MAG TPA: hypothetical protein VGG30_03740 [Pirellulales bacterium]
MLFLVQRRAELFRRWLFGAMASTFVVVRVAAAAPPAVEFDLPPVAVCRSINLPEIVKLHPNDNVVEVVFELSTRVVAGSEADIKHITVEIRSPDRQLLLVGYLPTTTMLSESSDGVIEVEQHRASGQIAIEYGVPSAKIQASAKNAGDSKIVEKKLAPKSLLVSSTTIDRSHGVVFRLYPSSQDSLEKTRQFVCQFAVPQGFRGDYVQLTCTAVGTNRGAVRSLDSEVTAGVTRYTVGIYCDGDVAARCAADLLAQRQEELANLMLQQAGVAKPTKTAAWWHNVSKTMMSVSHSKAPQADVPRDELALAVAHIEAAQRAIRQLNGQRVSR